MADQQAPSGSASSDQTPLTVNLQLVSPTAGVPTLNFPSIEATSTIQQLKGKIREALPSRPADNQQRLIYRGRLLSRDRETLQDVFGANTLRSGEQQIIHLVLSDLNERRPDPPANPGPYTLPGPMPGQTPVPTPGPSISPPPLNPPNTQFFSRVVHSSTNAPPERVLQQPQEDLIQRVHQQQLEFQRNLTQQIAQRQHALATELTMHGVHNIPIPPPMFGNPPLPYRQPSTESSSEGQSSSSGSSTAHPNQQPRIQEQMGPNGRYRRVAPNGMAGPFLPTPATAAGPRPAQPGVTGLDPNSRARSPHSAADFHNILRGADATRATQAITDAMNRNAPGAPSFGARPNINVHVPVQPIQPGVTTSSFTGVSRHSSRTATPQPSVPPAGQGTSSFPGTAFPTHPQPEVYILSSPTGPRGLLINGSSEVYYTPAARPPMPAAYPFPGRPPPLLSLLPRVPPNLPHPMMAQSHQHQLQRPNQHETQQQPPARAQQPQADAAAPRGRRAPRQVNVVELPGRPVVFWLWPHVWLIIRLAAFVWWFTSGDSSWSRWITVLSIAIAVFIANTGLLNDAFNQVWDPLRRHLEGLLPLADPNRPRDAGAAAPRAGAQPDQNPQAAATATTGPHQDELDPAQVAARLVAQHRNANANWLMDQVRRGERAVLLFLASIAPGVAERHIAQLEAQERRERQRREAAEAAAVAAAAAAAAATAAAATAEAAATTTATQTAATTTTAEGTGQDNAQGSTAGNEAGGNQDAAIRQRQPFEAPN